MSDRIKIHDLPGLLQYGTALNSYGDNVEAAAILKEYLKINRMEQNQRLCLLFLKD